MSSHVQLTCQVNLTTESFYCQVKSQTQTQVTLRSTHWYNIVVRTFNPNDATCYFVEDATVKFHVSTHIATYIHIRTIADLILNPSNDNLTTE